jgi:integrase
VFCALCEILLEWRGNGGIGSSENRWLAAVEHLAHRTFAQGEAIGKLGNATIEQAEIDPTPHEFRHSWVTHLRAGGVDPADLADVAGHSVQTATSRYAHPLRRSFEQIRSVVG